MLARGVHARVAAVLGGLVVLTALSAVPAAAAPAPPTGLTPTFGDVVDGPPVLSWDRSPGATTYDVQVSTSEDFSTTPIYSETTYNRRATPIKPLPMTGLHWRVRAKGPTGTSEWAQATFSRSRLAGPVLQAPADGDVLDQPDEPVVLRWGPVAGATAYTVEIDRGPDADWVGATTASTRTTSYTPGPLANGSWAWRVTAAIGTGQLTFPSASRTFTVGQLAEVTGVLPVDGQDLEDVVLDWDPVPGAVTYDLRVSTDDQFPTDSIVDDLSVAGTRYSPPQTYDVDDYWWQVRAVDPLGAARPWSAVTKHSFTRSWDPLATTAGHGTDPNPVPDPNGAPRLLHPADTLAPSATDDLYFQWTPVRHATLYQLDVGTDENFSPHTFRSCRTPNTTYTPKKVNPSDCLPSLNAETYWRVKAIDDPRDVQGYYSPIARFTYARDLVSLTAPANGASVDLPTLSWQPVAGAERYRVTVESAAGARISTTTYSTSWTPTELFTVDDGPYTWTVDAVDSNDVVTPGQIGAGRTFTVSGAIPTTAAAPLTPLDQGASPTARFPALRWEPVSGAHHYRLYVGVVGAGFRLVDEDFVYPAATDAGKDSIVAGSYRWFAQAMTAGNQVMPVAATPYGEFTVLAPDVVGGQRVALGGTSLDSGHACGSVLGELPGTGICPAIAGTPVLDWEPDADTAFYMVYVARDRNFQNMVYGEYSPPKDIPTTLNTRWIPTETLPESQAGTAYYWYVRPCKAVGVCGPDPIRADHAFEKRSPAVTTYPVASTANDITFSWQPYLATNQAAAPHAVTGERPAQEAHVYEVEVSDTAGFDHLVDEVEVDQPTYTAFADLYPEGNLYWRVRAHDGDDRALPWSETRTFLKSSPKPSGIAPVGTVTASDAFRWTATPFAGEYEIEVYKNGDTAASLANRVVREPVEAAAYAPVTPLPADVDYVWRTRRIDAGGNDGAWSDWRSFRIEGTAPALELPAPGATVPTAEALFTWNPAAGATSYRFERRPGTGSVAETVKTAALAWAPLGKLTAGAWQWRVTSLDAAENPIASSAWRDVTVQGAPVASVAPLVTGSGTVGELLHVTAPTWDVPDVVTTYQWLRNGVVISGATGVDYEVVGADVGRSISVRATGTLAGYDAASAVSNTVTGVLGATASATTPPVVAGTGRVGTTLTATLPTWDQTGVVPTYRWLRDGVATASGSLSLALRDSDVGRTVVFEVTGKKTGYADAVVTSTPLLVTAGAAPVPSEPPTLTGVAKVGQRLSAKPGTWGSGVRFTYQWLRDGRPIPGATASSYTPVAADATRALSARVIGSRKGYDNGTATTAAVTVARMTSTTRLTLPATTVKARAGRTAKVRATVTVVVTGWPTPTGQVRVLDGKKVVAKVAVRKDGTARVTLKGLKKGKHRLVATYDGTATAARSTSARLALKVV